MRILAISGSLQAGSSNTAVLVAAADLAAAGVEVDRAVPVGDVPPFNPDLDGDGAPAAVTRLRAQLAAADGVLIATPEYAHSLPGSLKNALDWIVGSGELYGKPVAILSASPRPTGGALGRDALERTLGAQGALVVHSATVHIARNGAEPGLGHAQTRQAIGAALTALVDRAAAPA